MSSAYLVDLAISDALGAGEPDGGGESERGWSESSSSGKGWAGSPGEGRNAAVGGQRS